MISTEVKNQAYFMHKNGTSMTQIAKQLKISRVTVRVAVAERDSVDFCIDDLKRLRQEVRDWKNYTFWAVVTILGMWVIYGFIG